MTIYEGDINQTYEVERLNIREEILRRLEALGMNEGTKITVLNRKKNGACIIKVRGTRWAVGRKIASGILVKVPENE